MVKEQPESKVSKKAAQVSQAIEQPEELIEAGRELVGQATSYLAKEVKKNPYAVLGAAASLGYLFGQGWIRGFVKIGMAYAAQEAARRAMPTMGVKQSNKTVH